MTKPNNFEFTEIQLTNEFNSITSALHPWAEILESAAIILAVIIGGFWTYYIYKITKTKAKSEADLASAQLEAIQQSVIKLSMDVSTHREDFWYLYCYITISNLGNRNETITLNDDAPVKVCKVNYISNSPASLHESYISAYPLKIGKENWSTMTIRRGMTQEFAFTACLNEAGSYLVEFKIPVSEQELEHIETDNNKKSYWHISKFINLSIKKTKTNS